MTDSGLNTERRWLPIVLIAILLSPMSISVSHGLSDHEHLVCKTVQTHMHSQPIDCDLCEFSLQNYAFQFVKLPKAPQQLAQVKLEVELNSQLITKFAISQQGRAPPVLY